MTSFRRIEVNRRKEPSMPRNNKHRLHMTETDNKPDQAQPDEHEQPPPKFKLPPNCRDVTAEHIGEVIAMIGTLSPEPGKKAK